MTQRSTPRSTVGTTCCWPAHKASLGKRSQEAAARFEYHLEDNLIALQDELRRQDLPARRRTAASTSTSPSGA